MDLTMESILFIALLHCVLAYSRNNLPQTSFGTDVLYKPSYSKDSQTQETFFGNPSVDHKINYEAKTYHASSSDKMKNKKHLPVTEVAEENQKEISSKYPLIIPRVELSFAGTNGMLPVKIHTLHSDKKKPTKEHKATATDKPKPKDEHGVKIDSLINIYPPTHKPIEYLKQEDHVINPDSQHKELSQNKFGYIPSGWNAGIRLNPMNFYQTNPGMGVRNDQVHNHVQSTPLYNVLTGLVFRQHPPSSSEEHNHYTSTNKPDYVIDALQPTKVDFTSPGLYRNVQDTEQYMHEIASKSYDLSKKEDLHEGVSQSTPYKEHLPINVLKPPTASHISTKPIEKEVILPPVPTLLTLLQRQQLILLNTVAGLPGGSRVFLDAVRAG